MISPMPLTQADIQGAVAAGLTREVSHSAAQPAGGVNGDWQAPGPPESPGLYRRVSGIWRRVLRELTGPEVVAVLQALSGDNRLAYSALKGTPPAPPAPPAPIPGLVSLPQIGSAVSTAVTDETWKATGLSIPNAATWAALVVNGSDYVRGTHFFNVALWRTLMPVAADDPASLGPTETKLRLAHYLFFSTPYQFSAGRTSAHELMLQYDGASFDGGTFTVSLFAG